MYSIFEAVVTPVLFLIGLTGLIAILAWLETPKPQLVSRCRAFLAWRPVARGVPTTRPALTTTALGGAPAVECVAADAVSAQLVAARAAR